MKVLDLPQELFITLVCSQACDAIWAVEDLLHLSRACRKCRDIVYRDCDARWLHLYTDKFGAGPSKSPGEGMAMKLYKDRYMAQSKKLRLERRVALMKLHSDLQHARTELSRLQRAQTDEQARTQQLRAPCQNLQKQIRVQGAHSSGAWVPQAVRQSWDVVVSSQAVDPASRLRQIEQDLRTSQEVSKQLSKSMRAQSQTVSQLSRRLQALEKG